VAVVVVLEVCGAVDVVVLELQPAKAKPSNKITDIKAKRNFFILHLLSSIKFLLVLDEK
jgi:hypothetical protein